jgi:Chloride channel protein EriC
MAFKLWKRVEIALILSVTSAVIGSCSALLLKTLACVSNIRGQNGWLIIFIPVVGILTAFTYKKYGKGAQKGNNLIIESVDKSNTDVPLRMAFMAFCFTALTHLTGASAGREGTAVQIGGTLMHQVAKWFHLDTPVRRMLVMAGVSAGFGSMFGTPLTGAMFGLEVCYIGKISYEAILPCFAASFLADATAKAWGITRETNAIGSIPAITPQLLLEVAAAAMIFGIIGREFSVVTHALKKAYAKVFRNDLLRALVAGSIVLAMIVALNAYRYEGLSTWMISAGFDGTARVQDPLIKFVLTCLTLSAGFQGGEVTPLFGLGASIGGVLGQMMHEPAAMFAALGMISVFGCAANTPLATILLGMELFGTHAIPLYVIAVLISYLISGHQGIYSAQIVVIPKRAEKNNLIGERLEKNPSFFQKLARKFL